MAKISKQLKEDILYAVTRTGVTQRAAAEMFNVSHTTVQRVVKEYRDFPEKFDLGFEDPALTTDWSPYSAEDEVAHEPVPSATPSDAEDNAYLMAMVVAIAVVCSGYLAYILGWSVWK